MTQRFFAKLVETFCPDLGPPVPVKEFGKVDNKRLRQFSRSSQDGSCTSAKENKVGRKLTVPVSDALGGPATGALDDLQKGFVFSLPHVDVSTFAIFGVGC